ncbi:hypothetical protein [Leptothoe spongobia]|uniref:Uncharacterized protein n=1 Tax=Leptothoe spongobia TAU-MAC 1115 TaxID=1967444 RepID=A0A947GL63_9CYAN|nr:hypothetical protein [Leptothoe spongobia]MBT9317067.1 hypothetical protein [Leptothoe spongobia TAU-MAC 1115]
MLPNLGAINLQGWRQLICCLATTSMFWLLSIDVASAQSSDCSFFISPQDFNTFEGSDDRIVIGQVKERPYVVLLTHDIQDNLPAIRACIPDAFLTSSRLGRYINIASFRNYRDANELVNRIEDYLDVDVRLIHYSRLGR